MFAAFAESTNAEDPLAGLGVGERPEPSEQPTAGSSSRSRRPALNHHDIWSLRGVGLPADRLPMILGCDAAGADSDGNDVVVHAVIGDADWQGDETLDPRRSLLSERYPGTLAERVAVPRRNLVPKPPSLSFEEAACLPTSWLTAYRMLFTQAGSSPATACSSKVPAEESRRRSSRSRRAAGLRVFATSRDEAKRARALDLGAHEAFEPGARLPARVDAVMETVGAATWSHSLKSLRPGRDPRHLGHDVGPAAGRRRAHPDLLPAAAGPGLDHGHARGAAGAGQLARAQWRPADHRPGAAARLGARRVRRACIAGDIFGKVVFTP